MHLLLSCRHICSFLAASRLVWGEMVASTKAGLGSQRNGKEIGASIHFGIHLFPQTTLNLAGSVGYALDFLWNLELGSSSG
ncbi:hypothetical protein DFH07DRAFT_854614 [Mycena maculata]|uniref:Secreted protein n=1 Tax=Mycena maculata TaxID=230809 RepID=A0AAD7HPP7_9AGAR|nr:hypothetical protein DFH07DRAFT_854614 [Mycena maculata]